MSEYTEGCSDEVRFLLVMEIKRLAQPCVKQVDLRVLVEDDCHIHMLHGIKHYLSAEGLELYQHLYQQYKSYTVGVREGLVAYFTKQRDISLNMTQDENAASKPEKYLNTYISPVDGLLDYPSRSEERLKITLSIRIFFSATLLIKGTTADISRQGIRLHLDDETELTLIKGYRPVQLVIVDLDPKHKLTKVPITFLVSGVSKGTHKANVHLSRVWSDGPSAYNRYIEDLFQHKKTTDQIDTENTQIAIESKIYEQAFSANCPALTLFINTENILQPSIGYACFNDFSSGILDYWQDESNQQTLGYLFGVERLKRLLIKSDTDTCITLYCFNHVNNGKVYFYSATEKELDRNLALKDVFLSYASRKASWKVYKLSCHQIDPSEAFLPSSLPNGISYTITQSNRALAPKLMATIKPLTHIVTMSDITHGSGQQSYHQRDLEKEKIKLLSVFGHAKNRLPVAIEVLKFAWFDRRVERRYKLRTNIEILSNQEEFIGTTEDFSSQGLRVELDKSMKAKEGSLIDLSFPQLQEKSTSYDLLAIPYQVVRITDDGYVIHLKMPELESTKPVRAFFSMLIEKNRERLEALPSDNAQAGLRQALRVLQAKFSPQMCISIHQQKDLHYPAKTAVNLSKSHAFNHYKHQMPANFLNVSSLFKVNANNVQYIARAVNEARKQQCPVSHEVFTSFDASQVDHEAAVTAIWEQDLQSHVEKYNFIQNALKNTQFFACRVTCIAKQTPVTELYDEELKYLRKNTPKIAKSLESTAYKFSGHVFVTDITAEVLLRYRLFVP